MNYHIRLDQTVNFIYLKFSRDLSSLSYPPYSLNQTIGHSFPEIHSEFSFSNKIVCQEKLDILEEHISQLMNEIKKKNRIIQSYVMNLEPGALISEESDIHKVKHMTHNLFLNLSNNINSLPSTPWLIS